MGFENFFKNRLVVEGLGLAAIPGVVVFGSTYFQDYLIVEGTFGQGWLTAITAAATGLLMLLWAIARSSLKAVVELFAIAYELIFLSALPLTFLAIFYWMWQDTFAS